MKKLFLFFGLFVNVMTFAQSVSDYKYVIVPEKYDFLGEPNQYNLNALTKMVFEKQGYEVYYEHDAFPQELAENRCKALLADMKEDNTLFTTKIKLELKDCKNQIVFVSEEGTSREKEFAKAYVQAFRVVGKSLERIKSNPKNTLEKREDKKIQLSNEVVPSKSNLLFAQPIANGYQLVDATPRVIVKLFKTSISNFYIGQKETVQGVVFNKNNQWFFEYYQNEKLVTEQLEIKF